MNYLKKSKIIIVGIFHLVIMMFFNKSLIINFNFVRLHFQTLRVKHEREIIYLWDQMIKKSKISIVENVMK